MDLKLKNYLHLFLKGILIGTGNVFPGVSGGTVALILGIYTELVMAIKSINLRFLIPLGAGAGLSIIIGSRLIPPLIENFTPQTSSFFFGLIIASVKVPLGTSSERGYMNLSGLYRV